MSYMRASDQQQISSDSDDYLTVEVIIFFVVRCAKCETIVKFFPLFRKGSIHLVSDKNASFDLCTKIYRINFGEKKFI